MENKPPVIAVAGPTASGKSDLGLKLARCLGGEIVCMDSMQIYRRMDIGTAKPTAQEQALVPHHMLDVADPTEAYAVADYAVAAEHVIDQIISRGRLPILVGGTGLYLKALMDGLSLGGAGGMNACAPSSTPWRMSRAEKNACMPAWPPWTPKPPLACTPTIAAA